MNDVIPSTLATYARVHAAMPGVVTELSPELRSALADFATATPAPPSDRDAASLAVELLESDPVTAARLRNLPSPRTFIDGPTITVTAAVLIALQTHVRFERTPDGKWSILIEKQPTSDTILGQLVSALLAKLK